MRNIRVTFEDGTTRYMGDVNYNNAMKYAEIMSKVYGDFTIEEIYEDED